MAKVLDYLPLGVVSECFMEVLENLLMGIPLDIGWQSQRRKCGKSDGTKKILKKVVFLVLI